MEIAGRDMHRHSQHITDDDMNCNEAKNKKRTEIKGGKRKDAEERRKKNHQKRKKNNNGITKNWPKAKSSTSLITC